MLLRCRCSSVVVYPSASTSVFTSASSSTRTLFHASQKFHSIASLSSRSISSSSFASHLTAMPPKPTTGGNLHPESDPYTIREGKAIIKCPPSQQQQQQTNEAATVASASSSSAAAAPADHEGEVDGESGQKVFYNKVQVFNRDLSILMIQTFVDERKAEWQARRDKHDRKRAAHQQAVEDAKKNGTAAPAEMDLTYSPPESFPGITILEALSATGLRSVRYFKEITDVESIIVNDMDADAVKSIEYNIALNGLTTKQLIPSHSDAITLMQKYRPPPVGPIRVPRPTVVDLDPYGTAAPFLDSAVQAVDEGGFMCVTCTDKAILCGNYSETAWAKYGSMPLKGSFCHETAVRMVLNTIQAACVRYGRHMVPMLSMSIDFYVRVFVRVYTSAIVVKKQASNMGMILTCSACESFWQQPMGKMQQTGNQVKHTIGSLDVPLGPGAKCPECASTIKMGGPFWLGPLHNKAFITKALDAVQKDPTRFATSPRIIGSLTVCQDELQTGEERMMMDRKAFYQLSQNKNATATATPAAASSSVAAPASAATPSAAASSSSSSFSSSRPKVDDTHLTSILYYSLPHLFQTVNCSCPKISVMRSALINAGYSISQSHTEHNAIKTNAPNHVVWDIIRCWVRENPPPKGQKPGSSGEKIMSKEPQLKADFTIVRGTDLSSNATGVAKFLPNPEENWGPKARAGGKRKGAVSDDQSKRRKLNQNKRCRARQCKFFGESGTCKFGVDCKYSHVPGAKPGEDVSDRLHLSTNKMAGDEQDGGEEEAKEADADGDSKMAEQ